VNAEVGNGIGSGKLPSGKMTVHNLKTNRYPFKAFRQSFRGLVSTYHRTAELENNLRFNPWRYHAGEVQLHTALLRKINSLGIHVSPNRRIQVEFLPSNWIGEPDFAAHCSESSFHKEFVQYTTDLVTFV